MFCRIGPELEQATVDFRGEEERFWSWDWVDSNLGLKFLVVEIEFETPLEMEGWEWGVGGGGGGDESILAAARDGGNLQW